MLRQKKKIEKVALGRNTMKRRGDVKKSPPAQFKEKKKKSKQGG